MGLQSPEIGIPCIHEEVSMSIRRIAIAVALALAFGATSQAKADIVTVHIVNFDFTNTGIGGAHFDPTIHAGDTVEWVWDQGFHSTTSAAGLSESWNSGAMAAGGQTFDHTFTHVGNFAYYCVIHGFDNGNGTAGGMSGIVHVLPAAAVPEPSSLVLAGTTALGGLGVWARRRRA
jgi:plastocyanin